MLPHLLRLRPHALEREAPAAPVLPEPGLDLIAPALGALLQQHLVGPHRDLDAAAVEALVHAQREQPAQLRRLPGRLALLHQPLVVERQPLPHRAGLGCAQRQAALIRQHRQIGQHRGGRRRIARQTLAQQPQQLPQQHLGQMRAHRGKIGAALAQRPAAQPASGRRHRIDGIRRIGQVGRVGLQRQTLQQPGGHRLRIGLTGRRHPADQAACQRQPVSTGDPVEMQLDLQPGLARPQLPQAIGQRLRRQLLRREHQMHPLRCLIGRPGRQRRLGLQAPPRRQRRRQGLGHRQAGHARRCHLVAPLERLQDLPGEHTGTKEDLSHGTRLSCHDVSCS